ncbi:calcium/sodium antiporter [Engelhardtia mirabilis]
MIVSVALVLVGLALLVLGGEVLIRAASRIADLAGVSPAVVGLTVVAAGTSMPELVVSLRGSLGGSDAIAVGNVIGSNSFNIGVILGVCALVAPLKITGRTVRLEWPLMLLAAFQLYLLSRDGRIDRLEGTFFLVAFVAFVAFSLKIAHSDMDPGERSQFAAAGVPGPRRRPRALGYSGLNAALGCGLLAGGAELLVVGATDLARSVGATEEVISLTIVAAGTSLPELFASIAATRQGRADVAISNVIGSNIFNVLAIVGVAATVRPLSVSAELIARDCPWMLGLSVLLLPLMRSGYRISRGEGLLLLGAYGLYLEILLKS